MSEPPGIGVHTCSSCQLPVASIAFQRPSDRPLPPKPRRHLGSDPSGPPTDHQRRAVPPRGLPGGVEELLAREAVHGRDATSAAPRWSRALQRRELHETLRVKPSHHGIGSRILAVEPPLGVISKEKSSRCVVCSLIVSQFAPS